MKKCLPGFLTAFLVIVLNASFASITLPSKSAATTTPYVLDPASTFKNALTDFKSISKKEKKERVKDAKHAIKEFKKQKRAGAEPSTNTVLLVILAILLPPLAVYLHQGEINNKFWLALVLTLLFWIPGVIYALIVVLGKD